MGNTESVRLMQAAGATLLTRSQAGLFGWLIGDARTDLVKGILALDPAGLPRQDAVLQTGVEHGCRLTVLPVHDRPKVGAHTPLAFEQQEAADGPGLLPCWAQKGTLRTLPNLVNVPVLVATSQTSYYAVYDHCTARYPQQAGVATTFVLLADRGMQDNGHTMMLELNNLEIAAFLDTWMIEATGHAHGHANGRDDL